MESQLRYFLYQILGYLKIGYLLWMASFPGQVFLGCIRNLTKYENVVSQQTAFPYRLCFKFLFESVSLTSSNGQMQYQS